MTLHPSLEGRVVPFGDCLIFTGCIVRAGYGRVTVKRKTWQAHRLSYSYSIGTIPDGMVLDHICRNRACVNPQHLDPTTIGENVRRGLTRSACMRGHDLTDPGNRVPNARGVALCRECHNARRRKIRQTA